MTKNNLKIAVALVLVGIAAGAHAQGIRPAYSYPSAQAGGTQLGDSPFYFNPYLGLAAAHDDNLFLSNTNKASSTLYIFSPGFKIDARSEASIFQVSYLGQLGHYQQSQPDNYFDNTVRSTFDTAFSGRSFLRVGYDYIRSHDPRGSTDRPISGHPDKYQLQNPNATFAFGAPGAQGRVELYASDPRKTYINNRATTALSDRDSPEYGGAFYWRVMPKTYVLAEARLTEIRYDLPSLASGEERRYYAGVSWEATAATTGTVKVGQLRRSFDSPLPSTNATSWEGLISWAPRTYSVFDFYSSRLTNESTGLGRFILTSVSGVNWNHAWSSVFNTAVLLRYQKDDYQGFDRSDQTKSLGFRAGYKIRRSVVLGAEYTHTQRSSNQNIFEYDKNFYLLTATLAM